MLPECLFSSKNALMERGEKKKKGGKERREVFVYVSPQGL